MNISEFIVLKKCLYAYSMPLPVLLHVITDRIKYPVDTDIYGIFISIEF